MKTQQCLVNQEMSDFDLGNLSAAQHEKVEAHLDDCADCAARFEKLSPQSDAVLEQLRVSLPSEILADDPELNDLATQAVARMDTAAIATGDTLIGIKTPSKEQQKLVSAILKPAQADDELGRLGTYRILKVLGTGGMGVVFQAEDTVLQRTVALKAMKPSAGANPEAKERFLREARGMAAIEHDNVITIHQVGEDGDVPFLAMQMLKGESLADRLRREGQLSADEALRITQEAAQGLAAAHQSGLIHRDIKPDNIWLEGPISEGAGAVGGRVKILDFGLARAVDGSSQLTQSGMIVGTPNYLAPEQAAGKTVDARSDLFSLGVVLYQMLSGQRPFERDSLMATLNAIGHDAPPPLDAAFDDQFSAIRSLLERLLQKDANLRFSSCADVIHAIDQARTQTQPVATVDRNPPTKNRTRTAVLLSGIAMVLLAGIIITVKDKDGNIIAKIFGPNGASVEVSRDGVAQNSAASGGGKNSEQPETITASDLEFGTPLSPLAMIQQPAKLTASDGELVESHTLETLPVMGATVAAVSPDGQHVATFSDDGMIRIWESNTRELRQILVGHAAGPCRHQANVSYVDRNCLAWNSDNQRLAVLDSSGELRVWNAVTGEVLAAYSHENNHADAFRWSPDGALLALRHKEPVVRILDAQAKLISELDHAEGVPEHIVWSPDSKTLATNQNHRPDLYLWDVRTAKGRRLQCPPTFQTDGYGFVILSWSPDGTEIAVCCHDRVVICNAASGELQQVLTESASAVAWSPDGTDLFVGLQTGPDVGDSCQIVRCESGKEKERIELFKKTHAGSFRLTAITPMPDHNRLLVEFHQNSIRVVDLRSAESREFTTGRHFVHMSDDGKAGVRFNSSRSESVYVAVDLVNDENSSWLGLSEQPYNFQRIACSTSGRFIAATGDNGTDIGGVVVDRIQNRVVQRFEKLSSRPGAAVLFSPNEKYVFMGGESGDCRIAAIDGSSRVEFAVPGHNVRAAAYSPDGHAIAVSGSNGVSIHDALDGSVRLGWKYADGMTHTSSIAWSPDGKLLAVTTDTHQPSRIHVYDVKSGEELQSLSESPETREQIGHVTWSPDGKYLAVTGAVDISTNEPDQRNRNKLVIWDTSEWQSVFTRPIAAVALRFHDRTTLVYATHDRQVLYENVETDKELRRIPAGVAGQYAIMSPDGEDLLSVNGDRIRVHSLTDGSLKGTILPFLGTRPDWAIISATGHYAGSPDAHKYARHVIRTRAGIRSLTPFEFRNEFSWKNDPSKVRLTAE